MNRPEIKNYWEQGRKYWPLVLFLGIALIFAINFDTNALNAFLKKYEKIGLIVCICVYLLLGVTPIPSEPVTILVVAWKGPVVAILLATIGNTLSAIVEFYIGGGISDLTDFEKKKEALPFYLGKLPMTSPLFLILARMLPAFGPKFVSIIGGIYQVPLGTYLWTTVFANFIGAVVVVLSSYSILKLLF